MFKMQGHLSLILLLDNKGLLTLPILIRFGVAAAITPLLALYSIFFKKQSITKSANVRSSKHFESFLYCTSLEDFVKRYP